MVNLAAEAEHVVTPCWIAGLPKVELHVHMEGAILPETLMRLAQRNNLDLPAKTVSELREWYTFTDFPHFADIYQTFSKAIVTADDIHEIAFDFLREQARQNIRYTEATFTALTHFRNNGLPFAEQFAAIRQAAERARQQFDAGLGLIVDIPREMVTPKEAMLVAEEVAKAYGDGLVLALGLAGYEPGFPPEDFAKPFALAAEAGVPAVVHGGETGPPEYVRGAIEILNAVRIGHGISAARDPSTLSLAKERDVTFEISPSSNVCLKVVESLAVHPFKAFDGQGVAVTINTDDPPMFNTDLNREYELVSEAFGYSKTDLRRFARQATRASFLGGDRQAALLDMIECYPDAASDMLGERR